MKNPAVSTPAIDITCLYTDTGSVCRNYRWLSEDLLPRLCRNLSLWEGWLNPRMFLQCGRVAAPRVVMKTCHRPWKLSIINERLFPRGWRPVQYLNDVWQCPTALADSSSMEVWIDWRSNRVLKNMTTILYNI